MSGGESPRAGEGAAAQSGGSGDLTVEYLVRLVVPRDVLEEEVQTHARSPRPLDADAGEWDWADIAWMAARPGVYAEIIDFTDVSA